MRLSFSRCRILALCGYPAARACEVGVFYKVVLLPVYRFPRTSSIRRTQLYSRVISVFVEKCLLSPNPRPRLKNLQSMFLFL